jgi:hypothetical protein
LQRFERLEPLEHLERSEAMERLEPDGFARLERLDRAAYGTCGSLERPEPVDKT